MDTIFAMATARGKAGVAVVRVSGPDVAGVADSFGFALPVAHRAALRSLHDATGQVLDRALVLYFPDDHSFTGEATVELHLHGSPAIVAAVLDRLSSVPGYRLAEPGEFTRRALENDRLDLAQVEGLGDLIEAETEAQRRQAMRVFSGALGVLAEDLRADLLRAIGLVEVTIDFADEDVPVDVSPDVLDILDRVTRILSEQIDGSHISERLRDGFEVAIIGAPNVGKSTLLNAMAGRDAAITSEIAGTTRDVIEVRMDLRGLPVTLLDTAGIRDSDDRIEALGVARAVARAEQADLRVFLHTGDEVAPVPLRDGDIMMRGKADLDGAPGVSGLTGAGVDALLEQISDVLGARASDSALATHARHRDAMSTAKAALESARIAIESDTGAELTAEEMRRGIRALESLVGRLDVEAVLGEIFSSFCIGK